MSRTCADLSVNESRCGISGAGRAADNYCVWGEQQGNVFFFNTHQRFRNVLRVFFVTFFLQNPSFSKFLSSDLNLHQQAVEKEPENDQADNVVVDVTPKTGIG